MIDKIEGRIFKGVGGFYYVDTKSGVYTCRARGIFRKDNVIPCIGDSVLISVSDENKKLGTVDTIFERKNFLIRPPVANIDCVMVVIAPKNPSPNFMMVDKILAICNKQGIQAKICINKEDLSSISEIEKIYRPCGYEIFITSAKEGTGIHELILSIRDNVTVFAGNSGVGKSSLINAINENYALQTGDLSRKIERGMHTTRHVEFYKLTAGGFVADTPGFSKLELYDLEKEDLADDFLEFRPFLGNCQFTDCSHTKEKGCNVLHALKEGKIHPSRHENYCLLYQELKQTNKWK